jgi:amidohydrolase
MTTVAIEKLWQSLHAIPEPAFKEVKTAKFVADYLQGLGYQVETGLTPSGTGVLATLDSGKKGPVVGLRTDMDCLMFTEGGKEVPVHACGHDGHMSMVLTAAANLAKKGLKKGKVKLVFQPAEEIGLGAKAMLATGKLEDLNYLFGVHLMPKNLVSSGQVAAKVNWQACTLLTVTITGLTAHGSMPHLGISALDTGCAIVNAVNAIHLNPLEGWSVKATRFNTGTGAINAICDHAEISFDLRTTLNSSMAELKSKIISLTRATARAYG